MPLPSLSGAHREKVRHMTTLDRSFAAPRQLQRDLLQGRKQLAGLHKHRHVFALGAMYRVYGCGEKIRSPTLADKAHVLKCGCRKLEVMSVPSSLAVQVPAGGLHEGCPIRWIT